MRKILSCGLLAIAASTASAQACTVTKAGYDALRDGMTVAEAERTLGCPGEELSSSSFGGITTIMLMWEGDSLGANMNAMFQNNAMISKAQFGLN